VAERETETTACQIHSWTQFQFYWVPGYLCIKRYTHIKKYLFCIRAPTWCWGIC